MGELLNLLSQLSKIDAILAQHDGRRSAPFLHKPKQQMFGADVIVAEALRFLVGQRHGASGTVGESFEHEGIHYARSARIAMAWR